MKLDGQMIEVRNFLEVPSLETRAEGTASRITGYASVYDSEYDVGGYWVETVRSGAFDRNLKEKADVRALFDHDTGKVLGRTKSGTLTLKSDSRGLFTEITPPDTSIARDVLESLKRGDIDGMSFGFRVMEDKWSVKGGKHFRELIDVELYEVSVVAFPAYKATSAQAREEELRSIFEAGKAKAQLPPELQRQLLGAAKRKLRLLSINHSC